MNGGRSWASLFQYICTSLSRLLTLPPVPPSPAAPSGPESLAAECRAPDGIDLHRLLIPHPASTFLLRVSGDSMTGAGIRPGDLLIVDRSVEPRSGRIVVARLDDAFTLKRLVHRRGGWWLEAAHPAYPSLALGTARDPAGSTADARLWGVALHAIRRL
jgi:DNA polymerase V